MELPINRGPDFSPPQWLAAAMGLLMSAGAAHIFALTQTWSVALMIVGFCLPPAVLSWLEMRRRKLS